MRELPLELLQIIVENLKDGPSILNLRLVSKTLNSVATPRAFRVVIVRDSVKSAQAVSLLQDCNEAVTASVREVVFQGDYGEQEPEETAREGLKMVFSRLTKFPNLQKLQFDFNPEYEEEDNYQIPENPTNYLQLQNAILAALAANPPPSLVSLTLNNLIAMPDDIYAQESFHRVFRSLQALDISVLCDAESEGSYFQDPLVDFWNKSLPHMIRSATAVTALTIRSNLPVGAYPALSFKDTFLPGLSSLALYRFVLEPALPDSDVVAFILRHKATLTHLTLHDCSIDGGEEGEFPRPWNAVFETFKTELGALREFVLENEAEIYHRHVVGRDSRFEYTRLDPGWGYMPSEGELPSGGLDLPALESLMDLVESRQPDAET
ncbi:hypothetical protein K438DRAFT_2016294 [Mycena galopus ATCC 62051]|nr:hypothetical protein K438DRAFT_2016294 [Mycena galopus ATCC 62051]